MAETDYAALINQAVAKGDYAAAANYEQQRNAKINAANAAGTNTKNYTTTNNYNSYLPATNTGTVQTSQAQQVAQATSPATAATGQTKTQAGTYAGGSANVSNAGEGVLTFDPTSGNITRTMGNGSQWYSVPGDAKYEQLYLEYYNRTGQDPRGIYGGMAAIGEGAMQAAANSNAAYIAAEQAYANQLAGLSAPAYVAPKTSAQEAALNNYIQQLGDLNYTPVDAQQYLGQVGDLDSYVQQAVDALTPGYKEKYDAAYNTSSQNLDRAGLFNSLYAQALVAQQQNAVTNALMAEAGTMGMDLRQQAFDNAMAQYQAAISENQFGSNQRAQALSQAANLTSEYISILNEQAKMQNDYQMQAYLGQIEQYQAAADAMYKAGALTSQQYENMLAVTEMQLNQVQQQLAQAEISNTNADTEKIKAETQAIMAEMSKGSGGGSSYRYSSDDGYNPSPGAPLSDKTEWEELSDVYKVTGANRNNFISLASQAGYDVNGADKGLVNYAYAENSRQDRRSGR